MRPMDKGLTPFEALKSAVRTAGSMSALARMCGVSPTAVWKWVQSSKRLPAEHVLKVEAETGVSRHLLRPDIYPFDHTTFHPGAASLTEDDVARESNPKPIFDRSAAA